MLLYTACVKLLKAYVKGKREFIWFTGEVRQRQVCGSDDRGYRKRHGQSRTTAKLGIPLEERGYLFINAVLCEVPGVNTNANEPLNEGDHVGIFSVDRLYPYQYRDGLPMSDGLKETLKEHGAMHHPIDRNGQRAKKLCFQRKE